MRRNRTRINRNRFDNRNPLGRYRADASGSREFKAFWKEFEDALDEVETAALLASDIDLADIEEMSLTILVFDNAIKFMLVDEFGDESFGLRDNGKIRGFDFDLDQFYNAVKKRERVLGTKPKVNRGGITILEYDSYGVFNLDNKKLRKAFAEAFEEALIY